MSSERAAPPDRAVEPRGPIAGLADLAELLAGESPGSKRFLRALVVGTFIGAAIAGSSIWQRSRRDSAKR